MRIASSVAIAVLALTTRAHAQGAEAEALFREGKRLLKAGEIAKACEKLEASERLEQQSGTELNLADCREQNGQIASAWAMFVKAAETAKHGGDAMKQAEAHKRAKALEARLVFLTIDVPDKHAVDGLVVKKNDTAIDPAMWNQPMPVDPGDYAISAEAPGRRTWSETVVIRSKNETVTVPRLPHHKVLAPEDAGGVATPAPAPPEHPVDHPRKYRTAALALGLSGVGAIAIASGFALYSKNLEDQANVMCPTSFCTDQHSVDLNHVARVDGWIANIGWGLGAAALVGAGVAWWAGRADPPDRVSIVPFVTGDRAGVALGGRF